jgi:hypothetical protein
VDASIAEVIARQTTVDANAYLLVAHDSATCGQSLDALFSGTTLTQWQSLGLRQPYIALLSGSDPTANVEFVGDAYTSLRVNFVPPAQLAEMGTASL